jgi:hypothetical protein
MSSLKFISNIIIMKEKMTHRTQPLGKVKLVCKYAGLFLALSLVTCSQHLSLHSQAHRITKGNVSIGINWHAKHGGEGTKSHCHFYLLMQ